MPDYKKMYAVLCKAIDDAIEPLKQIPAAKRTAKQLQDALLDAEQIYIDTSPYDLNTCQIFELNAEDQKPVL